MAKIKKKKIKATLKETSKKVSAKNRKVLNKSIKPKKAAVIHKPIISLNKKNISKQKIKSVKKIIKKVKTKNKVVAKLEKKPVVKKIVKKITVKVKKTVTGFAAESLFKAKIKVIGLGGGGGSIVSEIGKSLEKATFVIADTDVRALKKRSGIKYFWFGEELTHGLGTGVNVELAKQAAELAKDKISSFFKDQDIIIFVASLGGGLGSGATQVFAEAAKEFGGITLGIFTTPFKFEGKNKQKIAQNALKSLRKSLNVSLVIPNEKIFKVIDESTPITNAFSTVNKSLIGSLESLIDLIYSPGIINIDFADLRTILKGVGNSAFLNTIEESGKDRVEKICERIFKNPLLQNNDFKAEKILFNIAGGENLSMFEVEKISSHISNLNPKAKIIFGISKNVKLGSKIKTTILMTGSPDGVEIKEDIVKLPVIKKEEVKIITAKEEVKKIAKVKKPVVKVNKIKEKIIIKEEKRELVPFIPAFEEPEPVIALVEPKKNIIEEPEPVLNKKTIRRSGLEIRKAEELQEKKKMAQEKEWEIPAFMRKVKFKG